MNSDYRKGLLKILSKLDQLQTDAEVIRAEPLDSENAAMAEEIREPLVEMQAKVEAKLDRAADTLHD